MVVHRIGYGLGMLFDREAHAIRGEEVVVARALVTVDEGGVVELLVVEIDGVLVDVATGVPVDLVSLVVVEGLPELEETAA